MTTALAHRPNLLPDTGTWKTMLEMAGQLVQSGLLPQTVKTPAAALAIIQKGQEIGVPPMYALSNIGIINGKPVVGAEVLLAMIYRDHGDLAIQFEETGAEGCTLRYKRRTWTQARTHAFTIEEAEQAGLLNKGGPWKQYPAAMLRARCISAVARLAFPDSIGGMYTPEELGAEVTVTDDGAVEVVSQPAPVVTIVPNANDITPPDRPADEASDEYPNLTAQMAAERAADAQARAISPERATFEAEYRRLAAVARERNYKHVEKINSTNIGDKSDEEVARAVATLQKWEASLREAEPAF